MSAFLFFLLIVAQLLVWTAAPVAEAALQGSQTVTTSAKITSLDGKWEFYWQQLLTPSELPQATPRFIDVPDDWNNHAYPQFGYATYRKVITIPPEQVDSNLAMLLESVGSSYTVWMNGTIMDRVGRVGSDHSSETPDMHLNIIYFTPKTEQVEIVMQVSNFSFRDAGILGTVKIGSARDITLHAFISYAILDLILIGAMLVVGIYYLMIMPSSQRNRQVIIFGILCLIFALRIFFLNSIISYTMFPELPWDWLIKLKILVRLLSVFVWALLLQSFYPKDIHPLLFRATIGFYVLCVLTVFILPTPVLSLHAIWQGITVLATLCIYGLYLGIVTIVRKREGAKIHLTAAIVLIGTFIHDSLLYTDKITGFPILSLATLLFLLAQALIISNRFSLILEENKRYSTELQLINAQLEQTVAERTEELHQKNVQLSSQIQQRSKLMANIAHDMGSPLTGVQSTLLILKDEELESEEKQGLVALILAKVSEAKHLIENLFQLAKLESKQFVVHWEQVSVEELLNDIHMRFEPELRMRGFALILEEVGDVDEPMVTVNRQQLQRVLQNLLDNAVKYGEAERKEIVLRSSIQQADGDADYDWEWLVEIVDFGKGIAEHELPMLFDRFYTRNPGETNSSGLGLAIVKEIVELHHGHCGVQSEVGKGSIFYFAIPVL